MRTPRTRMKGEDGLSIIGVVIASFILILALIPAARFIESTLGVSGGNQRRIVAANIAAGQLEALRLQASRSFTQLVAASLGLTNGSSTVNGVQYSIQTRLAWTSGTFSSGSCNTQAASKTYNQPVVEAQITVGWPNQGGLPSVVATTVLAPPVGAYSNTSGNLLVSVTNAANQGSQNIAVTLVSSSGTTTTYFTDAGGCAFFPFQTPGTYTVELQSSLNPGYVDNHDNASPSQTVGIALGNTTTAQFQYDQAATIQLSAAATQVSQLFGFTAANPSLTPVGTATFTATGRSGASLFPFTAGYSVWLGTCFELSGSPQYPTGDATTPVSVSPAGTSTADPSYGTADISVTVAGLAAAGAQVYAVPLATSASTTACSGTTPVMVGTTDATGSVTANVPFGYFAFYAAVGGVSTPATTAYTFSAPGSQSVTIAG